APPLAVRAAAAQGQLQRRRGRPGRDPAARARRQPALLRQRGGPRGADCLRGEAPARLRKVPQAPMSAGRAVAAPAGALALGIAVAAGAYLIAIAGWQLLVVGAASILAGVLYTGGPRPYGYEGLGELFVFLFFGVVAVVGSYYVQTEHLRWTAFALSVPVGLLVSAILVVNNLRDID